MNRLLPLATVGLVSLLVLTACPYGDGAYYAKQQRKEAERRARSMGEATRQTERGTDLAGAELTAAVSGRTWVSRYVSFPNGDKGNYILYRHFRADGTLEGTDNFLNSSLDAASGDTWTVDGPRLCLLWHAFSADPHCYRVARAANGALQVYVDDPGSQYDTLLTMVITEVLAGPAPPVASVLGSPDMTP